MSSSSDSEIPPTFEGRLVGRIPVRNIWLLMLYASDLSHFSGRFAGLLDNDLEDLPNLIGRLLADEVARRLARNLSLGYRQRSETIARVRGRIDLLATASGQLMDRGLIACRFEEITIDTVRNRLVLSALERIGRYRVDPSVALVCRSLVTDLGRAGVSRRMPSRAELAKDQISRNDSRDLFMLALARLAFDLALPTEESGLVHLRSVEHDEHWVRKLFEKAVGGFYRVELIPAGWGIHPGQLLQWQIAESSPGAQEITPSMRTDIVLDTPLGHRIVIDTKFTSMVTRGWYRESSLKTNYLYQMYAYLRSQERQDDPGSPWNTATGIMLHPAIDRSFDEYLVIQNHRIRFATVNLSGTTVEIRQALRSLVLA